MTDETPLRLVDAPSGDGIDLGMSASAKAHATNDNKGMQAQTTPAAPLVAPSRPADASMSARPKDNS